MSRLLRTRMMAAATTITVMISAATVPAQVMMSSFVSVRLKEDRNDSVFLSSPRSSTSDVSSVMTSDSGSCLRKL